MSELLVGLAFLYAIVSQGFALYFWYVWAQTHGFFSSLFIGPLVGEFKGLLWPFFM